MSPVVLAFAGAIGSGKSTVSIALATKLGWPRTSFGDYVREEAVRRNLDSTSRDVLQALGEKLIAEGWEPFCWSVLKRVNWMPGQPLIIDGVRHVRALDIVSKIVAPSPVRLIYLELGAPARLARLRERAPGYDADVKHSEAHSSEREVSTQLRKLANYHLATNQEVSIAAEKIIAWLGDVRSQE